MANVVAAIAIYTTATGALVIIAPSGTPLRSGQSSVDLPMGYNDTTFSWSTATKTMIENPGKIEKVLLAQVDAKRETSQMLVLTNGGAKKYVYNRKDNEASKSSGVLASVLNALSLTDKQKNYPAATKETMLTGELLSVVLLRFQAGMAISANEVDRIEAIAQVGKRAIKAATTAADKRAAFAAINWNWAG